MELGLQKKNAMCEDVKYDLHSRVATIRLNRPESGNVVNSENLNLMHRYLLRAEDDDDCRCVVIEGSKGVFSRGMDFAFMLQRASSGKIDSEFHKPYLDVVTKIRSLTKPVVAAIDGEVLAGGMGIALACDIVIATKRSVFGLSEVVFGLIPAYVFPFLLERVSFKRARYMVLSSEKFSAEKAHLFGVVDELVEDEMLEKRLIACLKRLLASSPRALTLTKSYSEKIFRQNMDEAVKSATKELTALLNDKGNIEAIQSFIEGGKLPWMAKYKRKKRG